jgi:hypothetical protein
LTPPGYDLVMVLAARTIDGIELTGRTDFADLAHRALLGTAGGALRSDCFPLDWVLRVYHELAGSPYADILAHGVAACLAAPEPEVREQARIFFEALPSAIPPRSADGRSVR